MCTVSFLPVGNKVFITSNRDEKRLRPPALLPNTYHHNDITLTYPKDVLGGTWIAHDGLGNGAVLLNGGHFPHVQSPPYRMSRGLVFLDIVASKAPLRQFFLLSLQNIEPFTVLIYNNSTLVECRWDGSLKYTATLDPKKPHLYSSSTLYTKETVQKRAKWFQDWLIENPTPNQGSILRFHNFTGDGDKRNDFVMDREGITQTVSITSVELSANEGKMTYIDLY